MGVMERITRLLRRSSADDGCLVVENTGEVSVSNGGQAVTGYSGPPPRRGQKIVVKNTGDATSSGPGSQSVSGIHYT